MHTLSNIQAPIGACKKRAGETRQSETRQSDTRQSDNHVSAILFSHTPFFGCTT